MKKIALFFAFLFLISCHKDDDPVPTCGCDSPTINTITNQTGVLKKNSGNFKNTNISSSYYIVVGSGGNINGYLSVCNIDFLSLITVVENTDVNVVFSGESKTMCSPPATFDDYYQDIKLTQIQKK